MTSADAVVHTEFPAGYVVFFGTDENSAPDFAILREDAQRQGKRYGFEDVLPIAEVVSASSSCRGPQLTDGAGLDGLAVCCAAVRFLCPHA